jgi:uncharacterized protein (DUF305 family)
MPSPTVTGPNAPGPPRDAPATNPGDGPAGVAPSASASDPERHGRRGRTVLAIFATLALVAVAGVAIGYAVRGPGAPPPTVDSTLPAGPVDIGFAQDMLDHHDQAVQLASYAQAHATSPMVQSMAAAVLGTQRYEIGVLEQFLRDHGAARGDPDRTVMAWMGMPEPHDHMPGLQSHEAVVDFLNQQGPALDREFLTLMIDHHQGGVHMASYAADHAESATLRQLVARMVVDQQTEIGDYQAALRSTADP